MKTTELYSEIEKVIPPSLSCEWDNDGISVLPDKEHESRKILFALDLRNEVLSYAKENGFDTVITHHPLLFSPVKELCGQSIVSEKALFLIKNNIAAMSFHTRFDAMDGGVNDVLCDILGLKVTAKFGECDIGRICTVKKTEPEELAEKVRTVLKSKSIICALNKSPVEKVAVCGGSMSGLTKEAKDAGADAFICGELKYHETIDAQDQGLSVICAGHYETEFPAVKKLNEIVLNSGKFDTEIYEINVI